MIKLRSEHIKKRLFWSMTAVILCLLSISVPLIVSSYQYYLKASRAMAEIEVMRAVADLSNLISGERGPANKLMSSSTAQRAMYQAELEQYRRRVDVQFHSTQSQLQKSGFIQAADQLENIMKPALIEGRLSVDSYAQTEPAQRTSGMYDTAVREMFNAWDQCHQGLKSVLTHSVGKNTSVSGHYILIYILADMRDQAGRIASTIIPAVTFNERIPDENLARSLQTQKQVLYLLDLVDTFQLEKDRTDKYLDLHQQVKREFLDQVLPLINGLIRESYTRQPYTLTTAQLTDVMVGKFAHVVNLQQYLLEYSENVAKNDVKQAAQRLSMVLLLSAIFLSTAVFILMYASIGVLRPLLRVRDTLLELSDRNGLEQQSYTAVQRNSISVMEAMQKLQQMLQQRDQLENQLRNIASTDKLTGVSNRVALDEYTQHLEKIPEKVKKTGLIIFDIDDFKQINDHYGHIVGDQVIKAIAGKLRSGVRNADMVVRYGGDEFVVLLENVDFSQALKVADNIRLSISECEECRTYSVSVSVGVAVGGNSWMALLKSADQALFRAKGKGKNMVEG